jgi:hypothetical protein
VNTIYSHHIKIKIILFFKFSIGIEDNRQKSSLSLIRAMDEFNLSKGLILTEDNEEIIEKEGKTIE